MNQINSNGRYGIIGSSGSGKSNNTWLLLGDMRKRKQPLVMIDHKGEYLDLPGCEVARADTINPRDLAVRLRESKVSLVVDMRSCDNKQKWLATFITGCLKLPRQAPVLIAIEEAHEYCPQVGDIESKVPVAKLAALGRGLGYGFALISQRCSNLDKNALTQAMFMFIHRHHYKTDLNYLEEIVGKENVPKVKALNTGSYLHLDYENDVLTGPFQMPLAKNKKIGHTPKAVPVTENKEAFYRPNLGRPIGSVAQEPTEDYGIGIYIMAVVIVCVVILASFLIYRSMEQTDQRTENKRMEKTWSKKGIVGTPY